MSLAVSGLCLVPEGKHLQDGLLSLNKGLCWFSVWITFGLDYPASVTTNYFTLSLAASAAV